jgi:niacin transporter
MKRHMPRRTKMKTRELTIGALFSAMTLLIILVFSPFLKIAIPPFFTATIMLHVPLFLSMLISPSVAGMVGLISAIGFMLTPLGPIVALRALMHGVVGYMGGLMVEKGVKYSYALAATLPVHALLEGIVVVIAMGLTPEGIKYALTVVAAGTVIHHGIDSGISLIFARILKRQLNRDLRKAA